MSYKNNRIPRQRLTSKGFRAGHLAYKETPLKDVILVGQLAYQVKSRDRDGKVQSLYPRTRYRRNLILARFYLWRITTSVRRFFSETRERVFRSAS